VRIIDGHLNIFVVQNFSSESLWLASIQDSPIRGPHKKNNFPPL